MKALFPFSEICPHCEEGILATNQVTQDIVFNNSLIRVPKVQVEECRHCGFRSLSGKDVGLFELLFRPEYARVGHLISALKRAGYYGMFLKEDMSQSSLAFGSRDYVAQLAKDLRGFYLDNESNHIIRGLSSNDTDMVLIEMGAQRYSVKLPKLGEGENGIVYEYLEDVQTVLKIAKPRAYSRDHLKEEYTATQIFEREGIPVPRIIENDPYGSFMIKEKLAGDSLAKIYHSLGGPETPRHLMVRSEVERFIEQLLNLFTSHPEVKTSVSPNNIFVLLSGDSCRCLLVDTGPAPLHDYSRFSFSEYWQKTIPQKIEQYKAVGYL